MKEHNNSNLHEEIKSNGKGEYPRNICLHKNLYRPLDLGIIEMKVWKAETVDLHHLRRFYYHLNLRIRSLARIVLPFPDAGTNPWPSQLGSQTRSPQYPG
ncbi:uncharacterized protein LOC144293718 isoform X3 [Canis aureus]